MWAVAAGIVTTLAGYWMGYRHGRVDGWHRGSSDTAAYVANHKPDDALLRAIGTLLPGLRVANYVERWAGEAVDPDLPSEHTCRPAGRRDKGSPNNAR